MPTLFQFAHFRLDQSNQRLDGPVGPLRLHPKAFEVLCALVERAGELVTKAQLLHQVWPDTHVSAGVLSVCISELRSALGDCASAPRLIETVHRRGYRFVANVTRAPSDVRPPRVVPVVAWPPGDSAAQRSTGLVGRVAELALLEKSLEKALTGERQVVFVTGEPGAGKTALVAQLVARAAARERLSVTGGQSLEQFGSAEPYLPVLEAIGRLARESAAARALLLRCAPTWLAQLPWLFEAGDRELLERELLGATRDRMLRELSEFVEAHSAETPLILVLEDLHWSDPSTVDLLSLLATRVEPARLLVIGTYRPVDLILSGHPLRAAARALLAKQRCNEIVLDALDLEAVAEYLERRFPGSRVPRKAAELLRERTDGNPLFLVTLVAQFVARGVIARCDERWKIEPGLREQLQVVPESVRLLIEEQLGRLPAGDRELMEAASLAGIEFSAATVATAAGRPTAEVEARCARLAGAGPFLSRAGSAAWPDGTVAERYAFRHALYREAIVAALPPGRSAALHLAIGRALERAGGEGSQELAVELAIHFENGGDRSRALRHRRLAAETAARRFAFAETETHLEAALALVAALPASLERDREECALQSMLATVRQATRGYAAPEVVSGFARALELSPIASPDAATFPALTGIWTFCIVTGELDRALALAERNHAIAEASGDRLTRLIAHEALWTTHLFRGELAAALRHLDEGEPLYDPVADRGAALVYATDPKAGALCYRALALWARGEIDRAMGLARRAVEEARALGHPMSLGRAMIFSAWLRNCRHEPGACRDEAELALAYCREQGLPFWMPHALGLHGWALAEMGEIERGTAELEQGLALWSSLGATCGRSPHDVTLAAVRMRVGRLTEARELIERAKRLAAAGERFHEPEIHRLEAALVLAEAGAAGAAPAGARARAEALLGAAIECAQRSGARTLELRAATSLARVCSRGARRREARARLAELYASFTEGLDTRDLRDARRLLRGAARSARASRA